jgi:hypothetical protein
MRAFSPFLRRFRHSTVLPSVALITAMLLISGQILTCCGLNESLSNSVARTFRSMGFLESVEARADVSARTHPTCHGHTGGTETGFAFESSPKDAQAPAYDSRETCLNEMALAVKAQASGPAAPEELLPVPKPEGLIVLSQVKRPLAGSRPSRTDTGPPVYLRTLRILV